MSENNIRELADAAIYLRVVESLTFVETRNHLQLIEEVRQVILSDDRLRYTNRGNVLSLLLNFGSPLTLSIQLVKKFATEILETEAESPEDSMDIEEIARLSESKQNNIIETANEVINDCDEQNKRFQFILENTDSLDDMAFKFITSKVWQLSTYIDDLGQILPLLSFDLGGKQLIEWIRGIFIPFKYYWDNYGSLQDELVTDLNYFLSLDSFEDRFLVMLNPLNKRSYSEKLSTKNWMQNVLLPLIHYHNDDFDPLIHYLFSEERLLSFSAPSEKYELWRDAMSSLVDGNLVDIKQYRPMIKRYLAACYFFAIFHETADKVSSLEITKIYDLINETLSIFNVEGVSSIALPQVQLNDLTNIHTFAEFIDSPSNPLQSLIEPTESSIASLKALVQTCEKLFPINKLTLSESLRLHSLGSTANMSKEKEVLRILSNITSSNWQQLFSSVKLFLGAFVLANDDIGEEVNRIIYERFLYANLFEVVDDFYSKQEVPIHQNVILNLILKKFWDSFNHATSLNDKSGKLLEATQSMDLLDKISSKGKVDGLQKEDIIRIKHLLKALSNMKNFRIFYDRKNTYSPSQITAKFGSIVDASGDGIVQSPLTLITLILEQNPKSYLAYEKLYKILSDLTIYSSTSESIDALSSAYFGKLLAACIESALVDNNFEFAYKKSIELFEYYSNDDHNMLISLWLTFYQVGKFVSPNWMDDADITNDRIETLIKQREILSMTLRLPIPSETTIDNSKLIIKQWNHINNQIELWYTQLQSNHLGSSSKESYLMSDVSEKFGASASSIIDDVTTTTNQANEKLSNLFVSGLGWAIGANQK